MVIVVVYVDDLILVGVDLIPGLLEAMRKEIEMEDPHSLGKYLGATHRYIKNGPVTTMQWDMSDYMKSACRSFEAATGRTLKPVATPYVSDLTKEAMDKNLGSPGEYGHLAASMLMRLLYPARMAFPMVVLAIQRLAKRITKWCSECDRRMVRLFEYAKSAADECLQGCLSEEDLPDVELHVYPDGDLCGNFWDTKSTSGLWIELAGKAGRTWPLTWGSKAQPATSHHTQEAEMVSLSIGIRNEAAPLQLLIATLIGRPLRARVFEDNEACIVAAKKGYSPSLRHLARHQRIALGSVHETFFGEDDPTEEEVHDRKAIIDQWGEMLLEYKDTKEHKGDFFTKELARPQFEAAVRMMNVSRPSQHKQ